MRSEEVEQAMGRMEMLKEFIKQMGKDFKFYDNENSVIAYESLGILLNYISELEDMLSNRIAYTQLLEKDLFENCENYVVNKDKIRNKLIELSKKLVEPNDDRWEKDDDAYYNKIKAQILVLKELLGA